MSTKYIYLVRHGRTQANDDHTVPGKDEPLNDTGHHQANVLAERMENVTIDHIITSDFIRTHQTAAPTASAKKITPTAEACFGEFYEPTSLVGKVEDGPEVQAYRSERNQLHDTDPSWEYEDGDTFIFPAGISIMVVSHAFYLKAFITSIIRDSYEPNADWFNAMMRVSIDNTILFTVTDGAWKAVVINDRAHFAE